MVNIGEYIIELFVSAEIQNRKYPLVGRYMRLFRENGKIYHIVYDRLHIVKEEDKSIIYKVRLMNGMYFTFALKNKRSIKYL